MQINTKIKEVYINLELGKPIAIFRVSMHQGSAPMLKGPSWYTKDEWGSHKTNTAQYSNNRRHQMHAILYHFTHDKQALKCHRRNNFL